MKPLFAFIFEGVLGHVWPGQFVTWGGSGFQLSAAGPLLREVIEVARRRARS